MKKFILLFIAFTIILNYADAKKKRPKDPALYTANLESVLKLVQNSYLKANAILSKEKLVVDLESASVTFKITNSVSGGGEINILIAKFGKKWSKDRESSVTFNLEKSTKEAALKDSIISEEKLVNIIVNSAKKLNSLNPAVLGSLSERSFDVDISFAITKTTSGGIEIKFFSEAASLGLEGELAKAVEQSISLKFKLAK